MFVQSYNEKMGGEHVNLNFLADLTNQEYQASYLNKKKQ